VFAYSNSFGGQRTLVVYHNRFGSTAGWIRRTAVTGRSLGEGLGLASDEGRFLVLRDHRSGMEFLRSQAGLARDGLYLELDAYRCDVVMELRVLADSSDGRWRRLADWLGGRGVPSLEVAMREMELAGFHAALRAGDAEAAVREAAALVSVPVPAKAAGTRSAPEAVDRFLAGVRPRLSSGRWVDEWLADRALPDADLVAVGLAMGGANDEISPALLRDPHFRRLIGVNEHEGVEWFNKERFEETVGALGLPVALGRAAERAGYRLDRLADELPAAKSHVKATPPGQDPRPIPGEGGLESKSGPKSTASALRKGDSSAVKRSTAKRKP
jgi:hypothetical protein